jgi:hypothetical protein
MVRYRTFLFALFAAVLLAPSTGCDKAGAPMHPLNGPRLVLSTPPGLDPSFTLALQFKYRATSGGEAISGEFDLADFDPGVDVVNIPLPSDGRWMVSGEYLNNIGVSIVPLAIGVGEVEVQGPTTFALPMGVLNVGCYEAWLADVGAGSLYGNGDLFTFNTNSSAPSTTLGNGDIQVLLDAAPSLYLGPGTGPVPTFAYLGTGDWVDHTVMSSGTIFHADSLTAKRAARGIAAVTEEKDVYVVKLTPTTHAWLQVTYIENTFGLREMYFRFRVDRSGLPWMRFDVTQYGDINCNTSGVTLY